MAKVITFSRTFPAYHPKAGQPTYFVEKVVKSLHQQGIRPWDIDSKIFDEQMYYIVEPKHHTIRAGNRWKVGDKLSPRVWSGKPYNSKQIIIAPDIEIKKIWDFEYKILPRQSIWLVNNVEISVCDSYMQQWVNSEAIKTIALNDGLSLTDLCGWFPKPFKGQIICWSDNVNY